METKKEERSEYVTMYVTPSAAKEFKEAKDNKDLQDSIIKRFVTSETDWLKTEMVKMDEITLRYRAKLLTIKDRFSEAQDVYVREIEALCDKSYDAFKPLEGKFTELSTKSKLLQKEVQVTSDMVKELSGKIGYIDYSRVEKLLDAIDRFNKMSDTEKELVKMLLARP